MEHLQRLAQVYNSLCQINTSGEDTITMANCLVGLRETIMGLQAEMQQTKESVQEESIGSDK